MKQIKKEQKYENLGAHVFLAPLYYIVSSFEYCANKANVTNIIDQTLIYVFIQTFFSVLSQLENKEGCMAQLFQWKSKHNSITPASDN